MLAIKKFIEKYSIIIILLFFIILGATGLFYNYGIGSTVGEETVIMAATLKMISEPTLRPDYSTFNYLPVAAYVYLPFFVLLLTFLRFTGIFTSTEALKNFGIIEFAKFLPVARFISVLFGAASIYILYKICFKLFNNKIIALIASYLLSVNLLFVQQSHLGKVWPIQIFFILLAFYYLSNFYLSKKTKLKNYTYSGLLIGLSFATHIIGIIIYVPFVVIHFFKHKSNGFLKIFIKNKYFWITNIIIILFIPLIYFLDPHGISNYISYSGSSASSFIAENDSGNSANIAKGLTYYLTILFEYSPLLLAFFLFSSIFLFFKKREIFFIIYSFIISYYILIGPLYSSNPDLGEPRYILPLVPFMVLIVAYGLHSFYRSRFGHKKAKAGALVFIFICLLYFPIKLSWLFAQKDTRLLAREWINNNVKSNSSIVVMDRYLELNENKETLEDYKEYNEYFFSKKRNLLFALEETELPYPNYYVLTPQFYDMIPKNILGREYDYWIITWWNRFDYNDKIELIKKTGFTPGVIIKRFPEDATDYSDRTDVGNNMRQPFYYLRKMKISGPVIDIYKLEK